MPRRTDIESILIIGSGPIVIGQACEFDYSGSQAVKALRAEGYRVVLVNSNPATIMTDPELAHATYIEPLSAEYLAAIIEKERPDALLPTLGAQTGLNLAKELWENGTLQKFNVEMIGADYDAIECAEDRSLFKTAMEEIGVDMARSGFVHDMEHAFDVLKDTGFPAILRPSYTLGGTGGSIAYNRTEYEDLIRRALDASPTREVLVEESLIGWKEIEMELIRDANDNAIVVCPIENFDPMGVHTGDSITIAPTLTLSDREYQDMREESFAIMRKVGVKTGGCNIQFSIDPKTGRRIVIEINPRVSRSSALASKATGFPIAKVAALLAVGYTLDELTNDMTNVTPASFEPTVDYTVAKIPRFAFEKFHGSNDTLSTQMKAVGEVMAIARSFPEALNKAARSLENKRDGIVPIVPPPGEQGVPTDPDELKAYFRDLIARPTGDRLWYLADALGSGLSKEDVCKASMIDPWFIDELAKIVEFEAELKEWNRQGGNLLSKEAHSWILRAKRLGISDSELGRLVDRSAAEVRQARITAGIRPVFKQVDTQAGAFKSLDAYLYSTYEEVEELPLPESDKRIMILGGGPNRIGQGIEFDYCAVHGVHALREQGYQTILINCNPETVSTDYDTPDRLYFEPLTFEDVMEVIDREKPQGVILQFGGQTPLNLALPLMRAGVNILGTHPDTIDRTEDRKRFNKLVELLQLKQPAGATAIALPEALQLARNIGYPVLVRPSYVLGGRAMAIVYNEKEFEEFFEEARKAGNGGNVLIDKFLDEAIEVDVDCIGDGEDYVIGGILEHIEEAGVHSGDSACCLPPHTLSQTIIDEIERQTLAIANELKIVGLMNVQYAIQHGEVYIIEVNPRASRTIPFISKAIGHPLAKYAARVMAGEKLRDIGYLAPPELKHYCVKEAVFPFNKFPDADIILSPEMKSTGEVLGIDSSFERAFLKAQIASGNNLPSEGTVFISVRDRDKEAIIPSAKKLHDLGFSLMATEGTAIALENAGLTVKRINKLNEGRPHVVDALINQEIQLVINTTTDTQAIRDSKPIRQATIKFRVPYCTTIAAASASVDAMVQRAHDGQIRVRSLQEYHPDTN